MGFGAQMATSDSSSSSYSLAEQFAGSFANTNSSSTGTSQSGQSIWGPQAAGLEGMYGGANALAAQQAPQAAALGQKLADQGMAQGAGFQKTLQGLSDPTAQIAAQEASLKSGLGSLFREELNPAITTGAIGAGGLGGGRQGVSQGVAAGQIADAYTQGLGDITANANAQAGTAASAGLAALPMMQQLGMSGMNAAWLPYQMQAGILGGPTALGKSQSQNASKSKSKSKSKAGSSSRSESKSQSDSFSVGASVGVG